jgi:nucleoside phosphorylase
MGSDTVGGSMLTTRNAILEVRPASVIMCGIAFGVDSAKQKIGDVVVSQQLQAYDLQRIGTDSSGDRLLVLRGDKVTCSELLLDRFRTAELGWRAAPVKFGLMLSGQKLIDNIDYREELKRLGRVDEFTI